MAEVEESYTIKLNLEEAETFKKFLGCMNNKQFAEFGITGDNRKMMTKIWDSLPYEDDE